MQRTPFARAFVGVLLSVLVAACAQAPTRAALAPVAPATPPPPEFVTEVEGIREFRLANGMQVLLVQDNSRPTTTVNVTYFVGSKHEGYGESGMAHLLEHLVFKGSTNFPEITQEISRRGGRANGTTWFDRTNYFQTFPASDDNLEWSLSMEADRMVNSFIRKEDLDSEMTVVRNEFEGGENNPFRVLMQRTLAAAYEWHGYGRSTIGARSDLENVPIERLQAFYRKYYQPDNAMLVVAGRFDEDDVLARIQRTFGAIPAPEREGEMILWPTYTREPPQDGERRTTVRRVGDTQLVMVSHHVPAAAHPDMGPIGLLAHVLGNAPSGRLYQALVEPGLAANVGAFPFALAEPGVLLLFAEVRMEQDLDAAERVLLETLAALADAPPTEEEVERARAATLRGIELTLNDSQRIGIELTEWGARGDWRLMFLARDRIEQVTPEEVARVAAAYLKPDNRTVGRFIPTREPDRAVIPEAEPPAVQLAGYTGRDARQAGEDFDASPETIEARLVRYTLDSGTQLVFLPKSTRGNRVVGSLTLPLGTPDSLAGQRVPGALAASMLMRGTQKRSRQEITDTLARLNAVLNVGGSATQLNASFEATRETLPAVLDLLAEILTEPSFPENEFETLRRQQLANLESARSEPAALVGNAFARLNSDHEPQEPGYNPTFDEAIAEWREARLEDARAFHQRFHGLSRGSRMVVVGDVEPDELRVQFIRRLDGWRAGVPFERIPQRHYRAEPQTVVIRTPDKANANLMAGFNLPLSDSHPDYPALLLGNYMLGGGFLSSRLAERIRQREGISYGVSSFFSAHPIDESGSFGVWAMYAPENRERLLAAIDEELRRVIEEDFSEDELARAKEGWLQSRQVTWGTDGQLAGMLSQQAYLGRSMAHEAELVARVQALSAQTIREAFARHLDLGAMVYVLGGDFPE
jgi:zinc protease